MHPRQTTYTQLLPGQSAVDAVPAAGERWGTSGGGLNLVGNAAPLLDRAHPAKTASRVRGWTVTVSTGSGASTGWTDDFQRADATGLAAVGNGWAVVLGADANINSGDLVRTDAGSLPRAVQRE